MNTLLTLYNDEKGLLDPFLEIIFYTLFGDKNLLILLIILLSVGKGVGQNLDDLKSKRLNLVQEIELTTKTLQKTQKDKKNALNQAVALERQVGHRRALVRNAENAVGLLSVQIDSTLIRLDFLQADLEQLKEEYSRLVRYAYRLQLSQNLPYFLFSAQSFNQAILRWRYVRQFERTRNRLIRLQQRKMADLEVFKQNLERSKTEKDYLLETVVEQNELLETELVQQNQLVKQLNVKEKQYLKALEEKRRAQRKIKNTIEALIQSELRASNKSSKDNQAMTNSQLSGLSKFFYQLRGKLPWPVSNAIVVQGFGRQSHPELKSIQITNNGIDIKTTMGADVVAVAEGEVAGIQEIPGYHTIVIIRHGVFYTVYSNLSMIEVSKGDKVVTGKKIGSLGNRSAVFHFEVWQQKDKLNPMLWLRKNSGQK